MALPLWVVRGKSRVAGESLPEKSGIKEEGERKAEFETTEVRRSTPRGGRENRLSESKRRDKQNLVRTSVLRLGDSENQNRARLARGTLRIRGGLKHNRGEENLPGGETESANESRSAGVGKNVPRKKKGVRVNRGLYCPRLPII